jgi:hypothetical protein
MAARLVERTRTLVPACWQRGRNTLDSAPAPRVPEPAQLYSLCVLTLNLHAPNLAGTCTSCAAVWPCQPVRLAYRLREGF